MHICVHSQTRDDGSRFQRSTATSHVILFAALAVIPLNIDVLGKTLGRGGLGGELRAGFVVCG